MTKAMIRALAIAATCYVGIDCSMNDYVKSPDLNGRQQDWFGDAMRRGDRDYHDWDVDNRLDRLENEQRYEREFGPRFRPDFRR